MSDLDYQLFSSNAWVLDLQHKKLTEAYSWGGAMGAQPPIHALV